MNFNSVVTSPIPRREGKLQQGHPETKTSAGVRTFQAQGRKI